MESKGVWSERKSVKCRNIWKFLHDLINVIE